MLNEHIDTDIPRRAVEIEGVRYDVAQRTVAVDEKLLAIRAAGRDRSEHVLRREELKLLLGGHAVKALFRNGREEDLDRLDRIYNGVTAAYRYESLRPEIGEIRALTEALQPLQKLLDTLTGLEGPAIRR